MIFLRNVLRAPARSLMTALGIAAGVALFVAITAITMDLRQQMEGAASTYNLEVVIYEKRSTSPFSSRVSQAQMRSLENRFGSVLSPIVLGTLNEKWNAYALVIGAAPDFRKRIPLVAGLPHEDGNDSVMVGEIVALKLDIKPGQTVRIDGRDLRVTGIFRTGSRLFDGGLLTDIVAAQRMLTREGAEPQYTLALLQGTKPEQFSGLVAEVQKDFPGLKAIPGTEFAGSLRLIRVVDAFVKTISVVALIGTCLVVSNTLLMAIAERTREIGILMAIGWSPMLVLRMLFAESMVLCAVGAALGNFFALALLRVVNNLESVGFGWIPVRYPPSLVAASLLMALMVALISLLWPALVLYRMQALEALRHE